MMILLYLRRPRQTVKKVWAFNLGEKEDFSLPSWLKASIVIGHGYGWQPSTNVFCSLHFDHFLHTICKTWLWLTNHLRLLLTTFWPLPCSKTQAWVGVFGLFILYMFEVLLPVFLTWLNSVILSSIHAVMRPIHLELYHVHQAKNAKAQKKRPSVVQPDGFEDQQDGEEITFVSSADQTNLRNRNVKTHAS